VIVTVGQVKFGESCPPRRFLKGEKVNRLRGRAANPLEGRKTRKLRAMTGFSFVSQERRDAPELF